MTTRLFFIRHGITVWNRQNRYCGRIDVGLSRQGRQQAAKLRDRLKSISFDRVYCSEKKRALQTCRILFGARGITRVAALREINFGGFEGLCHKEILKKYGPLYTRWISDPYKNHIPGAEPINLFKKRVNIAIKTIARLNAGRRVAVVCHGGVIGIFVSSVRKNRNFWRYVPGAASVTVVEYKRGKAQVKKFNDITHLE